MSTGKPYILTIAGFDPSGGAGILADCQTILQSGGHPLAVITSNTIQTHQDCISIRWLSKAFLLQQLEVLLKNYPVAAIKIGLVEDETILEEILDRIYASLPQPTIVIDPVLKSSNGYLFHQNIYHSKLLSKISLISPNSQECRELSGVENEMDAAKKLSFSCPTLLTGGHSQEFPGTDILFIQGKEVQRFVGPAEKLTGKHGSGCVFSSAITSQLGKGDNLTKAISSAKKYVTDYLKSSPTVIGLHTGNFERV